MNSSATTDRQRSAMSFSHEALLYGDADEFFDATLEFIRDGLAADEPILVVLAADKIDVLKQRLGDKAPCVRFADMAEVGANPARIIPTWRRFADECMDAGVPFRGIGEPIWAERTADELIECQRHEALLNLAFADATRFRLLCPYDTSALGPDVLNEAFRSHRAIIEHAAPRPSSDFLDLTAVAEPFAAPLPEPTETVFECAIEASSLPELRRNVARQARAFGMKEGRIHDLVVAVNEITSNTVRHAGGQGWLRVWTAESSLICEVADGGHIADPLVGRVEPREDQEGGRGLWMATQLCDLVQVRSFGTGSVVRLHMHAP